MAVHSTQARISDGKVKHAFCNGLAEHPLLYDPLVKELVVLYDDYSCGREDFWDNLAMFFSCGIRIVIVEYIKNQMTLDYLIEGKHYTDIVRYADVSWPTRKLDLSDYTYEAIGWVGTYWPGCGLDELIKKCDELNIHLMAFGMVEKSRMLCPIGYAYWKSLNIKAQYFVNPEECIREASKCRWLMTTQNYSWLERFCISGSRAIISDIEDLRFMFSTDLANVARHDSHKYSSKLYSKPSELFIKW